MPEGSYTPVPLDPTKFQDPFTTAKGDVRASVKLSTFKTLWFNTGSLCNIACANCYMHSTPKNDDLIYLSRAHVRTYLDEIKTANLSVQDLGFTGGEPFMNPDMIDILEDVLGQGYDTLVLTNAMQPLWQKRERLLDTQARHPENRLKLRVSMDDYTVAGHEQERGLGTWKPMEQGLRWLAENGFTISVAGRAQLGACEDQSRQNYQNIFKAWGLPLDAENAEDLVLFPEMDETQDVPEITDQCWDILGVHPNSLMCATARMVVHKKGDAKPHVTPCTLLPYDAKFNMGPSLTGAQGSVPLNHPHCAKFCVLGGASCSSG